VGHSARMIRSFESVKLYSDRTYVPPGMEHVVMLYPFWGKGAEHPGHPSTGCFDRYTATGDALFEMAALEHADCAVLPVSWESVVDCPEALAMAEAFVARAHDAGKPVVIFFTSDAADPLPYERALVFRTSLYRSTRRPNEFAMPAWTEDFVRCYLDDRPHVRPKRTIPVVGFCGAPVHRTPLVERAGRFMRTPGRLARLRRYLIRKGPASRSGPSVRGKALRQLSRSRRIDRNFIFRDAFFGGVWRRGIETDWNAVRAYRLEYVRNMIDSDYVLCARGEGNFSYRLYETLSCGRIPIFVDTDCVLPFHADIDWKSHGVWVDQADVNRIDEVVRAFHDRLSADEFVALQHACRELWQRYLSPEGFFSHFHLHLPG
jgi:hypothetical protein